METMHLSSQNLTLKENTLLVDTGKFEQANITILPGITLNYIYIGNNLKNRKREISVSENATLNGSAIVFGKASELDIESEIVGDNATSQLNLLGLATEGSQISIAGNARVDAPYRLTKTRVDQKNILIGQNASVQGIPRLEIATDDIEGGHSCRIYRLGGDVLFYLTSRGLSHQHAEQILLNSEILSHLGVLDEENKIKYCQEIHAVLMTES